MVSLRGSGTFILQVHGRFSMLTANAASSRTANTVPSMSLISRHHRKGNPFPEARLHDAVAMSAVEATRRPPRRHLLTAATFSPNTRHR